jgi:hypothetical protein
MNEAPTNPQRPQGREGCDKALDRNRIDALPRTEKVRKDTAKSDGDAFDADDVNDE